MSARRKLIDKIKALLSKTVANGCTENEAMSALALAKRLMDENEIGDPDLVLAGEEVKQETIVKSDWDHVRSRLMPYVGKFCHCLSWTTRGLTGAITFCGMDSDTVFAHWLLDMLGDFVIRELDNYAATKSTGRLIRIERASFITGAVERIASRLHELTPAPTGSGRDLVIARNSLIDSFMAQHDIKLRDTFQLNPAEAESYGAGDAAGRRARFDRPLEEQPAPRLLR